MHNFVLHQDLLTYMCFVRSNQTESDSKGLKFTFNNEATRNCSLTVILLGRSLKKSI